MTEEAREALIAKGSWIEMLNDAQLIVQQSPLYRKFIDGTPLENDIAVWMAMFAQKAVEQAHLDGGKGVDISAGARAIWDLDGITKTKSVQAARACAEAWGLLPQPPRTGSEAEK